MTRHLLHLLILLCLLAKRTGICSGFVLNTNCINISLVPYLEQRLV